MDSTVKRSGYSWFGLASDVITVLLTASLLALPMEDGRFWPVAFLALVPLLLRMWSRSYWSIFFLGFSAFYLYLFYVLQWIDVYGFHWRVFLMFMNAVSYGAAFVLAFWLLRRFRGHVYATVLPTIIVLLEFKQTLGFLSFPWPLLCHSQCENLPLIQFAAITGCWGITFLIVNVNEALAHLIAGGFKARVLPVALPPAVLIVVMGLYGALVLGRPVPSNDVAVTLVQGSESTNVRWTAGFTMRAIDEYTSLTLEELASGASGSPEGGSWDRPRMVIWPETAIPDAVRSRSRFEQIRSLATGLRATFLVGCLTYDPADGYPLDPETAFGIPEDYDEYNSLVAFEPHDEVVPLYSKVHLVPFGEVIPLKPIITSWFPAYPWGSGDISPGSGFYAPCTPVGRIGAVICYESFYPQLARSTVRRGAEILVLVSNTSWFGRTRASFQHARFDVLRAVENGIWFCRAATTGVSSIVDPRGRVAIETELFEPGAVTVPIGKRTGMTLYTRWGDWVPSLCAIYFLALLLAVFVLKRSDADSSEV